MSGGLQKILSNGRKAINQGHRFSQGLDAVIEVGRYFKHISLAKQVFPVFNEQLQRAPGYVGNLLMRMFVGWIGHCHWSVRKFDDSHHQLLKVDYLSLQ